MDVIKIDGAAYVISKAMISYRQTTQSTERDALRIFAAEDVIKKLNSYLQPVKVVNVQIPGDVMTFRYFDPIHFDVLFDNDQSYMDVLFTRSSILRLHQPEQ